MASELINARKKFNAVNTMLKKGKYMSAVRNIHDGLVIMLKTSIMKSERDEFEDMLKTVTHNLNNNNDLRKIYPLVISYEPGEERKLLDALKELLKELQKAIDDDAQNNMQAVAALKEKAVLQGQSHLDKQEWATPKKPSTHSSRSSRATSTSRRTSRTAISTPDATRKRSTCSTTR